MKEHKILCWYREEWIQQLQMLNISLLQSLKENALLNKATSQKTIKKSTTNCQKKKKVLTFTVPCLENYWNMWVDLKHTVGMWVDRKQPKNILQWKANKYEKKFSNAVTYCYLS